MMDREIGAIFQSGTFQLLYASIRDGTLQYFVPFKDTKHLLCLAGKGMEWKKDC